MSEIDSGLINGANLVGGLIAQGQKTSNYVDGLFDAHAKKAAGDAIAAGDPGTAAGLLGSRGYLDEAQTLKDRAAAASTMSSMNTGDYAGAKTAAAASGDPALFNSANQGQQQDRQARAAWLGHAADALLQIKDPDPAAQSQKRAAAFQSAVVPTLKAMGVPDTNIASIQSQALTDENLNAFKASLGQVNSLSVQKMDDGSILGIDPKTGEVHTLYKGSPKADWKEVKHADGSTTWVDLSSAPPGGGGAMPAPDASATAAPTGGIYDKIGSVAAGAGAKPAEAAYLQRAAQIESGGNPAATNGSSTGLFQFHPDTFERAGGGDINDVGDQTKAALNLSRQDRASLQAAGIAPTDANVYLMHQQGAAGGKALLTADPGESAVEALTAVYGNAKTARQAIVNNGGTPDMTAGDFVKMWQQKWGGAKAGAASGGGLRTVGGSEAPSDDGSLSDDAVEQAAERYLASGQLPPMGQGKTGTQNRDKILNKAADMEKATGRTGGEAVAAWAGVKANVGALSKLTQARSMVESFENTASKNADLMLSLAPKGGGQTNIPVVNRWLQAGRKQVAGDADVTKFDIALGTFADEYAKIVSGATGSQGSTDASRKEAYDRLSKYATQGQLQGGVATMKQEMANRISSLKDQEDAAKAAISGKSTTAPPHAAALAPLSGTTAQQEATRARYQNTGKPAGDQGNPYVPRSKSEFAAISSGQWFINPADGQVMQKR